MIHATSCSSRNQATPLKLHRATDEDRAAFWRINGFRARLVIWTAEEWALLDERPTDAQYHPRGFWCALRID
jgi:hypothetical protein